MSSKLAVRACLVVLVILVSQSVAKAYHGYGPYSYSYGPFLAPYGYYGQYLDSYLPYYAVYPPKYYSSAMLRGHDPWASSCRAKTVVSRPAPEPKRITNPYMGEPQVAKASRGQVSSGPLRIINPYVAQLGDPGVSAMAVAPRRPQVIRPAALVESRQ